MKKQVLLGTALFAAISAFSQLNRTVVVKSAGIYDMKQERKLTTAGVDEAPISPMIGSAQQSNHNMSSKPAAAPTNVTWQLLSGSMNCYGQLVSTSRPLQYNPTLNAVSFIHRKSEHYVESPSVPSTAKAGVIVAQISTDWGATWDSTNLYSNDTHWGRYPQGAIYNPSGNTSIANAYVVGSGPTVSGTSFTGNWYASKRLNAFNNVAATGPGEQQFLSFTLPTYPANQGQHGWSRCGFSSTDDGIVRSIAVIENDLQGLSTMRGFCVVTGTFNGTAFDWSTDSLIPNCYLDPAGEKHLQPDPQMAFNQSGTIGYIVGIGAQSNGTLANMGYQPIVYKMDRSTNPAATWTLMPSIDFNSTQMRPIVRSHPDWNTGLGALYIATNGDTIGTPYFNDYDIAVDANGKLHIGATMMSTARTVPDSLNYISQFTTSINPTELYRWRHTPGSRPYIWDFITDGTTWDYRLIDSISTEAPSSGVGFPGYNENPWDPTGTGSAKVNMSTRLQMGRTPDGQYIAFSWAESDTLFTNNFYKWNNLPDLKTRLISVSDWTNTSAYIVDEGTKQNLTSDDFNVRARATLHYMSPTISTASIVNSLAAPLFYTVDVKIPLTVTNSNPYSQLTNNANWYGGASVSYKFRRNPGAPVPVDTTGIREFAGTLSTSYIYPNPAQNAAVIGMTLDKSSSVDVTILNMVGQSVRTIKTNGSVGENSVRLDLSGMASGLYLVNIKAGDAAVTKKLVIE